MAARRRTTGTPAARVTVGGLLLLCLAFGPDLHPRPVPAPADAPAAEFSAARAMAQVREIAQAPHPIGSAEHARVRDYLASQLAAQGLDPQIERGHAEMSFGRFQASGDVENILTRLPGTANTRPVMLAAHYDSVRTGPGAGDDAHGVAVLLETLRALRAGPPLRNDVIFLITDGEERGLLGASLFMREHPWRNEPGVALNFEARGTSGSAMMFETSAGNAWMIRGLREAVPEADATSVSYEIYRRMPNNTDLTVFKQGGLAGLNFAFIEHPEYYHTAQDTVEHLDPVSVQEQGRYALSLTRWFGVQDLRVNPPGDAVYFATAFTPLIVYSVGFARALAVLTLLGSFAAAWKGGWMGWMLVPLSLLGIWVALSLPGVSYVISWPVAGAVVATILLSTGGPVLGFGVRVLVAGLCAAAAFLSMPVMHTLVVALTLRGAAPIVAATGVLTLCALQPQIQFCVRRSRA